MNAKDKQSKIFNYLYEAEVEMSRKEVQGLINKLPHLPLPKGGHPLSISIGLNLNSIIMNSILFISILSSLIYFSQEDKKQILTVDVIAVDEAAASTEQPYREVDTREIENFESWDLDEVNLAEKVESNLAEEESIESMDKSIIPERNESGFESMDEEFLNVGPSGQSDSQPENTLISEEQKVADKEDSERMKRTFRGTVYYNHNSPVKISEADIKILKKDLLKQLKSDGFVKGKKLKLAIQCLPDGLRINTERLTEAQSTPYEVFLKQYSIPTATQRQIRLIDKFILIGDFDKDGNMLRGTLQGSGNIVLDNLEPIEEYYPLFSDKKEDALILTNGPCKDRLEVEDNITQLKQKLKRMLRSDELFNQQNDETRIWFPKEGIAVNNKLIPEAERGDYLELLREYGIRPCHARIIQITSHYVAVGDMVDGKFKGRIHGSFNLNDLNNINLKESILD
ncbi:MAG: hypothetical protein AAFR87_24785 [Bacteroidota bacterium]